MIDLDSYTLSDIENKVISDMISRTANPPLLEHIWQLMDEVWVECDCDQSSPSYECFAQFYKHPIWLLNGIFIEQHEESMQHRQAISSWIAKDNPQHILDFGGGFGTLARLVAQKLPSSAVDIYEPYPPRHGIAACSKYSQITFTSSIAIDTYDCLVCTDVLEHVNDPLQLLVEMVQAVHLGGHLLIANCFWPAVLCHLPSTFHFRYSFNQFCQRLGLEPRGICEGSHAQIYYRAQEMTLDWSQLRRMEQRSRRLFPLRQWKEKHISPWRNRLLLALREPLHYPRKLLH